jgi:hypothetical protein
MRRLLMQPPIDEKSSSRMSDVKGALRAPRSGRRPLTSAIREQILISRRPQQRPPYIREMYLLPGAAASAAAE